MQPDTVQQRYLARMTDAEKAADNAARWKLAGEIIGMAIILGMVFVAGLGWLEVLAREPGAAVVVGG